MDRRVSDLNQPSHLLGLRQNVLLPLCLKHNIGPILISVDDIELSKRVVLPQTDISAPKTEEMKINTYVER